MHDFLDLVKAISDTNRLRALCALRNGELCVCQIIELLELAPSTVSKHMSILRQAKLVNHEKRGRWMYYQLAGEESPQVVQQAISWVLESVGDSAQAQKDLSRVREIVNCDLEDICRK